MCIIYTVYLKGGGIHISVYAHEYENGTDKPQCHIKSHHSNPLLC